MPWRKKNFTLLNRLAFCLRIVLKYRIEVFKLLICLLFVSVNFGFTFRKIKAVVVVDENPVQSPAEVGRGGGIYDFRFNPAIKYTLQTFTRPFSPISKIY